MTKEQQELVDAVNNVVVVTMDSVPSKEIVEIKGLVELSANGKTTSEREVLLKKLAHEMGANALVGVKAYSSGSGGMVTPVYYGTAVVVK